MIFLRLFLEFSLSVLLDAVPHGCLEHFGVGYDEAQEWLREYEVCHRRDVSLALLQVFVQEKNIQDLLKKTKKPLLGNRSSNTRTVSTRAAWLLSLIARETMHSHSENVGWWLSLSLFLLH